MKRIDQLVGATVSEVYVTASGTLRLHFNRKDGGYGINDWAPMVVTIPPGPKKRSAKRKGKKG